MFPPLSYIEWIVGRPEAAAHDLGSSDLRPVDGPAGVVPPALRDLPDPPPETRLEAQIAAEYGVEPDEVLVTAGATHANFLAAATALSLRADAAPAPEVLVEKPGYEPLVGTPAGLGADVTRFRRPADADYALRPDRVESALTEATALVTVTNRHNPSGRATERATLREVSRAAAEVDATVLVDEVYAPFAVEPADGPFGGVSAAGAADTVVTNSLTKFFGLSGLTIGWLVGDEAFVDRARSVGWHVPTVAAPSRRLARRALHNADELARRSRSLIAENGALLREFVAERDDLRGFVSPGSTYAFPAHERADGDAVAAAAWEAGVLVVPGRFFGDSTRFRLSLGGDPAAASAGLAALGDALDSL